MLGFVHCLVRGTTSCGSAEIDVCCPGGFTVLSTKAVSTLLTTSGFNMFQQWVTYPVLAVSSYGRDCAGKNLADLHLGFDRHWRRPNKIS